MQSIGDDEQYRWVIQIRYGDDRTSMLCVDRDADRGHAAVDAMVSLVHSIVDFDFLFAASSPGLVRDLASHLACCTRFGLRVLLMAAPHIHQS